MPQIVVQNSLHVFGGGVHYKITLGYRGKGGGLEGLKKDYVIFEWPLIQSLG